MIFNFRLLCWIYTQ